MRRVCFSSDVSCSILMRRRIASPVTPFLAFSSFLRIRRRAAWAARRAVFSSGVSWSILICLWRFSRSRRAFSWAGVSTRRLNRKTIAVADCEGFLGFFFSILHLILHNRCMLGVRLALLCSCNQGKVCEKRFAKQKIYRRLEPGVSSAKCPGRMSVLQPGT